MSRKATGLVVVAIAEFALAASGLAASGAAGATPGATRFPAASGASVAAARAGTQLWATRFSSSGSHNDTASAVVASRDGTRVFVTGTSWNHFATLAYDASTGTRLWRATFTGPGNTAASAAAIAVSPGGRRVFVTGYIRKGTAGHDYATVAYSAATGARLWASTYNGPGNRNDHASAVAVSPDGSTVFVTGSAARNTSGSDYATVAYSASTGAQLWVKRYHGPLGYADGASSLALSPDGAKLFVTGYSYGAGTNTDYATVAYRAATGAQLWVKRYNGPVGSSDGANSVAVSPDGTKVIVTGSRWGACDDYATVAYSAATGTQLWVKRYNDPGNGCDQAFSVAINPGGDAVYVTGLSGTEHNSANFGTVAYRAATGAQLWVKLYNGPANLADYAQALAVSPDGSKLYVTGTSAETQSDSDYATVAYNAADGTQLWLARYSGPTKGHDFAQSAAVSPGGDKVFVTGAIGLDSPTGGDYATIAYSG